jgi:hypothetical protein
MNPFRPDPIVVVIEKTKGAFSALQTSGDKRELVASFTEVGAQLLKALP